MASRASTWAWVAVALLGLGVGALPAEDVSPAAILEARCLGCHGPQTHQGGLDLSTREGALRGGGRGPAIAPGDPDNSLLLARLTKDEMPPGAPLTASEKDALRAWIAAGAPLGEMAAPKRAGVDWWSLQPLASPPDEFDSMIDRFVVAKLRENGLEPTPTADPRTLVRRLSFDLIGLPPTPEEVEQFVQDERPDAYERMVDRLLASHHFGERWARHWLDIVRYAESEGFERDLIREHVWTYRDYVIRSFNDDKSYLEFAREQLAGDVLEPVTHDGIVATTLLTLGPTDAVGLTSAVAEQRDGVREEQLEELLGVVGQTFLGLTVNCARCHDHKFDPIAQKEYYRMKAAFQAVWQPTWEDPGYALDSLFPHGQPVLTVAERQERDRQIGALEGRIAAINERLGELYRSVRPTDALADGIRPRARWSFDVDSRDDFSGLHTAFVGPIEVFGGHLRRRPDVKVERRFEAPGRDQVVAVSAPIQREIREKTLEAWIRIRSTLEKPATLLEIRSQSGYRGPAVDGIRFTGNAITTDRAGNLFISGKDKRWENYSIGRFRSEDVGGPAEGAKPGDTLHLAITYETDGTISLYRNGELYGSPYKPNADTAAGRLQVYRPGDARVRFLVSEHFEIAEARLYESALTAVEVAASFEAGVLNSSSDELLRAMAPAERDESLSLQTERDRLIDQLRRIPEPELAYSAAVHPIEPTHVLLRGSVNQKGEEVTAGGVSAIQGVQAEFGLSRDAPDMARRKAMAEWIANPDNPLFSRVIVNRLWQHHFGAGLVDSPNDFGFNGGRPSHPELLDGLAAELIRGDWRLKRIHKLIVMSRTYRQSSRFDASAASIDSNNRLLWRSQPRRLSGEEVRDAMLAVSGGLNLQMYGPSFRSFELGRNAALQTYDGFERDEPRYNRRTIYRMNVNSGRHALLDSLDCPLPAVKTPKRLSTTTPLQALSLMNNEFVRLRAAALAERLRRKAPDVERQIERGFLLAYGRLPDQEERRASLELVDAEGLEALAWGVFNTSEFLYVE